ncbi:MAG: 4Fe-4S dicluster domain-containing protein [Firmicutes bacterium]|nr:4Fe-4S dicluster domain-containing protein [Bacillota bacterium]MBR5925827.1 4Fe-4S dicluster domain-containing protein [Bacillota bacterium]
MKVKIQRQMNPFSPSYWESFDYDGSKDISVAALLDYINYNDDMVNDKGERTGRIGWECSCLQGMCGACAMVINGVPALACETFLKDLKGNEIKLQPLSKFPVVSDLVVDRSSIQDNLKENNVYIGEYKPGNDKDHEHQYTAAKCLKCGLCLEVCPNYVNGKKFFGALFANDCYIVASRNTEKKKESEKVYDKHFAGSCSKALSCMTVCPMKIPTIASMAKINGNKL